MIINRTPFVSRFSGGGTDCRLVPGTWRTVLATTIDRKDISCISLPPFFESIAPESAYSRYRTGEQQSGDRRSRGSRQC